jgi:dihydroorotase
MAREAKDVLIRGGRVIDPASGLDETGDVLVVGGRIAGISMRKGELGAPAGGEVFDAEGLIVAPGLIDVHVHLREPGVGHEETIASGTAAAAAGGYTTVCCMPNTTPPLDEPGVLGLVKAKAEEAGHTRVWPIACATVGRKGEAAADLGALKEAGAAGFSDDGDCIASAAVMREVLRRVKALDSCFMQHCQEATLTKGASMNEGPVAARMGEIGWPAVAEEMIIERDVRLNKAIGARYHAQHVSSGESVEIVRKARAEGEPVTGEASPHHLMLTDEACEEYGTGAKMNPPLRTKADNEALKQGLADGTITILATDHAPHPAASKAKPFGEAAFGIVAQDCSLALYATALIEGNVLDWAQMLRLMTINPAELTGLDRLGLGMLKEGGPGDVTVIDPAERWTIDVSQFRSANRNCPYDGWEVRGRAVLGLRAGVGIVDRRG